MKAVIGFGEIKELFRSERVVRILIIAGTAMIIMTVLGGIFVRNDKPSGKSAFTSAEMTVYEHELEQRLAGILSDIEGVGDVSVMVTLDTSGRTEYGKNSDMLISVSAPAVRGVIVVCGGGDSVYVKEKVVDAVSGVFGISTTRISVAGSH